MVEFEQIIINLKKSAYRYIGAGSGRAVYDLGNGYVVKVAKNQKGIAQNKAEYKIALTDNSNIFAKTKQVSTNYSLLIMEKAERVQSISEVWRHFRVRSNRELYHLPEIRRISTEHRLLLPDLGRPRNWGKIRGKMVIVDYGFTRGVKDKYYSFH